METGELAGAGNTEVPVPNSNQPISVSGQLESLICAYSWSCEEALRIAQCESTMNPNAVSYDGSSYGLFQVNVVWASVFTDFWESWMIPEKNVAWAFRIWKIRGNFSAWSCN